MKTILLLDDDDDFRSTLSIEFEERGFQVVSIPQISLIPNQKFDFAIIDLRLKLENGIKCIEKVRKKSPHCKIVMLTGYPSVATAVKAIKNGAINYLTKPICMKQLESALFEDDTIQEQSNEKIQQEQTHSQKLSLAKHEREYIEYILAECNGNITNAAKKLGLHRQSLQRKLKKYPPRK